MDASTLFSRLDAATASFRSLERQLADPMWQQTQSVLR